MTVQDRDNRRQNRLLNGWKEIAAYFRRDESTVKRWAAQKGLPVHRVGDGRRAAIHADEGELEAWLKRQEPIMAGPPDAAQPAVAVTEVSSAARRLRWPQLAAACAALLLFGGAVALWRAQVAHTPPLQEARRISAAEDLYLDGVYHLETRQAEGLRRAIGLFTEAVTRDPSYADAYVGLANAYNLISQYTAMPPEEAYPKARAAAERALTLAPKSSAAYAALAFNTFYWSHDFRAAARLFDQAVTLNPANAAARHWYALTAMQERKFDIALREITEAQRLEPQTPGILANKGLILFHAGRAQDAVGILKPLSEAAPNLLSPHAYLATIYLAMGRYEEFLSENRKAAELSESAPLRAIAQAADEGYLAGGAKGMLDAMLAVQKRLYAEGKEPAFKLALTANMLGDRAGALSYLEMSLARGESEIAGIRLEPALASLRGDAGYVRLAQRVGYPQ